ncbi:MAG: lipid-A-disaccharide synthase [Ignavibacteria bacterium]
MNKTDIFVIAGESSGDSHSARLIQDILEINKNLIIYGIGGGRLQEQGVKILFNYSEINYIGFANIARNYFHLKDRLEYTANKIIELSPKVLILCDSPGFNLRIAKKIRKVYGGKIMYYITPQVWAWHKKRIKQLKKYIDTCFTILPFEEEILNKEGIKAYYSGSPVLRHCEEYLENANKEERKHKVVSIMPGTRKEEITRILPTLNEIGKILVLKHDCEINLICSENLGKEFYSKYINCDHIKLKLWTKESNLNTIFNSDFVITKFGTSNLECAFLGIPFVAVYKASLLNYLIAKMLVNLKYLSLVNIVMKKEVVKEYIQNEFKPNNVIKETEKIFSDIAYKNKMLSEFSMLKERFDKEKINPAEYICKEV